MTFDRDTREDQRQPERTPEQRDACKVLEQNAELRQLATEALIIHEAPDRALRQDLQQAKMTNVEYLDAACKVVDERRHIANALQANALKAYEPQRGDPSVVEQLKAQRPDMNITIPTFIENEQLEFSHMASIEDVARAGATLPEHRQVMEMGIPLQHQAKMDEVIGLPPGDLERSRQDYAQLRQINPFGGYAIYKIKKG